METYCQITVNMVSKIQYIESIPPSHILQHVVISLQNFFHTFLVAVSSCMPIFTLSNRSEKRIVCLNNFLKAFIKSIETKIDTTFINFEIGVWLSFQYNYFSLNLCTDNVKHIIESTMESLMTHGTLVSYRSKKLSFC